MVSLYTTLQFKCTYAYHLQIMWLSDKQLSKSLEGRELVSYNSSQVVRTEGIHKHIFFIIIVMTRLLLRYCMIYRHRT